MSDVGAPAMSSRARSVSRSDRTSSNRSVVRRKHRRRSISAGFESGNSTITSKHSATRDAPSASYAQCAHRARHAAEASSVSMDVTRPMCFRNAIGTASTHRSRGGAARLSNEPEARSATRRRVARATAAAAAAAHVSPKRPDSRRLAPALASAAAQRAPITSATEAVARATAEAGMSECVRARPLAPVDNISDCCLSSPDPKEEEDASTSMEAPPPSSSSPRTPSLVSGSVSSSFAPSSSSSSSSSGSSASARSANSASRRAKYASATETSEGGPRVAATAATARRARRLSRRAAPPRDVPRRARMPLPVFRSFATVASRASRAPETKNVSSASARRETSSAALASAATASGNASSTHAHESCAWLGERKRPPRSREARNAGMCVSLNAACFERWQGGMESGVPGPGSGAAF
jgi:hypothetical protein